MTTPDVFTRESNDQRMAKVRDLLESESKESEIDPGNNMRRFFTGRAEERQIPQDVRARNAIAGVGNQSAVFDNRVPLNLLPYKKDQITIEHARKTYRYRHAMKQNDSTIGLVYNNESNITEYRAELELIWDELIVAGKFAYERRIICLATEMGLKRLDKQTICNFSDLQRWAVHHSSHANHKAQMDVLEALTTMFFYKLDSYGNDYWLNSAVSDWTTEKKIVVDHDTNFAGNIIFGRKRASEGFVKSLFKRANLDYHISLLRRKLSDKYGVTFCRKQNPRSTIMEYRPVMKDGHRCGWIGHSAKNGQLWDDKEQVLSKDESGSRGTSNFLTEVVEGLMKRHEFELAGEIQRLLGRVKNRTVVGMDVERHEDGSETSPLTGGSIAQVSKQKWSSCKKNVRV
jgi:hypothetical protein